MKSKRLLLIGMGTITILMASAYWYVFVADAPQFDSPVMQTQSNLTFQLENFDSRAMATVRSYGLILPPHYNQESHRRYPVIFLLHGGHDDARAYVDKYDILDVLHQLYQNGKLPPSIIITPDGNDQRGSSPFWDPQYYDGPNGKVGTLIGKELVQVVKSRYRTLDDPNAWAIGGISSGGWGAFNIGLRYSNTFHILFSHSGYFTDSSGAANSPEVFVQNLSLLQWQALRIYLDAGESDTDLMASTRQFHQTLDRLGIQNVFHAFPGGHGLYGANFGWNYFHKHLLDSLSYVGERVKRTS